MNTNQNKAANFFILKYLLQKEPLVFVQLPHYEQKKNESKRFGNKLHNLPIKNWCIDKMNNKKNKVFVCQSKRQNYGPSCKIYKD